MATSTNAVTPRKGSKKYSSNHALRRELEVLFASLLVFSQNLSET